MWTCEEEGTAEQKDRSSKVGVRWACSGTSGEASVLTRREPWENRRHCQRGRTSWATARTLHFVLSKRRDPRWWRPGEWHALYYILSALLWLPAEGVGRSWAFPWGLLWSSGPLDRGYSCGGGERPSGCNSNSGRASLKA